MFYSKEDLEFHIETMFVEEPGRVHKRIKRKISTYLKHYDNLTIDQRKYRWKKVLENYTNEPDMVDGWEIPAETLGSIYAEIYQLRESKTELYNDIWKLCKHTSKHTTRDNLNEILNNLTA